ncbi:fimbrial domain protein, partial [Escherichia coli 6-319-05_S1_C2]
MINRACINCASGVNNFPFKVNGPTIYRRSIGQSRCGTEGQS